MDGLSSDKIHHAVTLVRLLMEKLRHQTDHAASGNRNAAGLFASYLIFSKKFVSLLVWQLVVFELYGFIFGYLS